MHQKKIVLLGGSWAKPMLETPATHVRLLISALMSPITIQLPTNAYGKAGEDGPSTGSLPHMGRPCWSFRLLALTWHCPNWCALLGNEPEDGSSLSQNSFSLFSATLSNKYIFKRKKDRQEGRKSCC